MKFFDAHLHIIDPNYPLQENNGYLPPPYRASDYLSQIDQLDGKLKGGAIVSGSFQGFDQSYLEAALSSLGPNFVGVTQVPNTISDDEIKRLNSLGVRAVRFNLKRGGSESASHLIELANRVFELAKWHVELYVDSLELPPLLADLKQLPSYSIDHLGLSKDGLEFLYQAVEDGAYVKATGFGRLDFDPLPVIKHLTDINPQAVMFGTDLPGTRAPRAFEAADMTKLVEQLSAESCEGIFHSNAISFYGLEE